MPMWLNSTMLLVNLAPIADVRHDRNRELFRQERNRHEITLAATPSKLKIGDKQAQGRAMLRHRGAQGNGVTAFK